MHNTIQYYRPTIQHKNLVRNYIKMSTGAVKLHDINNNKIELKTIEGVLTRKVLELPLEGVRIEVGP